MWKTNDVRFLIEVEKDFTDFLQGLRKIFVEILYEEPERLDQMNEKDLLKDIEYHFRDLVNTKNTCDDLHSYLKELENENHGLKMAIANLPGYEDLDNIDIESLK